VLVAGNKGRLATQRGVAGATVAKAAVTGLALAATAYSRALGERLMQAGDAPVEGGTTPSDETPRDLAGAQRQLTVLQCGTAGYLSPEQASGQPATAASDLYALGVVAYECLAGRRPFTGEHPIAVALGHLLQPPPPLPEDVPGVVRGLVAQAMANSRHAGHRTPRGSATNC
jgi:serine/threonine protein kinase